MLVTAPFALAAWSMWQAGSGALDGETFHRILAGGLDAGLGGGSGPLSREDAMFWLQAAGALTGALCLWSVLLAVGVALRRESARHSAIVTFLLFSLIAVPHGVGGWFLDPRPSGVALAAVAAVTNVAIVWLLATQRVADDHARAAFYRRRGRRGGGGHGLGGGHPPDPPVLAA